MARGLATACALVAALCPAGRLAAADADDATRRVSLADALAAAVRLPENVAAQAGVRAAEARVHVAGALGEPGLSIQTNSVTARQAAALSLPLPVTRGPRVAAAKADVTLASRSRVEVEAETRRVVRVAWFSLAAAEERARAATERAARAERNTVGIEALFEANRVARIDLVRARAEQALARAERESVVEAQAGAAARLGLLIGRGPDGDLATDGLIEPGPEPELAAYLARASKASPAVLAREAQAAAAAARYDLARREKWPSTALNAGADWNDPTQPGTNKWIGLWFGMPLGKSAAADAAAAERDREAAGLQVEMRLAADAAQTAWRAAHSARLRFEAVDTDAVPAAREAMELTRLAYKEGRADLFRVLDAERALNEALTVRADALEAWGQAFAELKALEGEETP
jgi:cobalt-zinc-cadmium efflux system outer membrane protein